MSKYLFAILVSVAVIGTSVYLFRHREEMFRPDAQKLGGTRLVFAIEDGTPDEAYLTAMRRRFDPRGRLGVLVHREEGEVQIVVPRGPAHDDTVARVERLAGRPGKFALVPVATTTTDEGVARHVEAAHAGKKTRPLTGPPPVPANGLGGSEFAPATAGAAARRYRWVRLGDAALTAFQLDPASLAGTNAAERSAVDRAARSGSLLHPNAQPEAMLLVARPAGEAGPAFFLLVRDESDESAINAGHIRLAEADTEAHRPSMIRIRFQGDGWERMMAIQHQDSTRVTPRPSRTGHRDRLLAVVVDDRVATLPVFAISQRPEVVLEPGTGGEESDDLVALLRGTPRGVRLSAKPTRVEMMEPRR